MKPGKLVVVLLTLITCLTAGSLIAKDRDAEIEILTDKAIAHINTVGRKQAYQDFRNRNGEFFKGEVYVVSLELDGMCVSHAVNPRLIGKNFLNFRDTAGSLFIKDIVNNIGSKGFVWIEYNWVNPLTKKIGKKRALAKMVDDKEYVLVGYWL